MRDLGTPDELATVLEDAADRLRARGIPEIDHAGFTREVATRKAIQMRRRLATKTPRELGFLGMTPGALVSSEFGCWYEEARQHAETNARAR